ncbi:MAG TPA: hypothetical protein VG407_05090 [Caulobacteraceae bacterium]|jgi:hypothetical protein|nr:hypothetical protein [Caulobacteraceae bacterium]
MDIHKPKPFHGWREFLAEITVIVTGIVIALGLDQGVEQIHNRVVAREAKQEILQEIAQNRGFMQSRQESQACVSRRLDEIAALLDKAGTGEVTPRPNWIGQPSAWIMGVQRWQAATSAGRTSLLGPEDQFNLANFYAVAADFSASEDREQAAWAQLRALETWRGPLGDAGRVHFATALQQARYELWDTHVDMIIALQMADRLGVKDTRARMFGVTRTPHAICLPITTTREDALRLLSGENDFGQPK